MQLQIISIGQKMPRWVDDACADYSKRLPRELALQWTTLPLAQRKGHNKVEVIKQDEADRIQHKLLPGLRLALDEKGRQWSSLDWSNQLQNWMQDYPRVNIIIGGPDGLSDALLADCHQRVSFGRMTMPHALVRVVLVEQIYRAWSICQGHPYHRE
ncbi:MAG: 23S rRNA (pseudouridine(1915)-N(3))-methyltransferase RlmH [Gammaproteobacteria bacterium]|nr:23S rRNA (pseudouridine(1915)-N(3))-methyltransferase RlmH [Gammaproteobacteria bacterium]